MSESIDAPESSSLTADAASPDAVDGTGFAALGLRPELLAALTALGYEEPTPIQREAIPVLLSGRDVLGRAATGTGKTAAFALPLLERLAEAGAFAGGQWEQGREVTAMVLVPTRELAMQVAEAIHKYGRQLGAKVLPIYGGAAMGQQLRALDRGVDVVVATPGRALDHVGRGTLKLDALKVLVLDEADEMLDMGFEEDLRALLDAMPAERQTALFSATMAPRIAAIASQHLKNPAQVTIARQALEPGSMPKVRQAAYVVPRAHKAATLGRVLDMEVPTSAIVFCRTRTEVDELTETLASRGWRAEALHGGMSQDQRDRVMKRFRANAVELLVATDVAARGLDVEHVSHVVNYDVPSAPAAYVHRIGRTGRAGREGVAITIAEPREHRLLRNIEQLTKQRIELAQVPTVADLRARRLELTRAALREVLVADGSGDHDDDAPSSIDGFRVVVETLADEFDLMDVAAAAVKLLHEATSGQGAKDEVEIPAVSPKGRERERGRGDRGFGDRGFGDRSYGGRAERGERSRAGRDDLARGAGAGAPPRDHDDADAGDERHQGGAERRDRAQRAQRARKETPWEAARVYIGAGRAAGIRPGDLVGAIANEVGIDASAVGAIEIADRFSLVEVPAEIADDIVDVLRGTMIRGKKVLVRRDREAEGGLERPRARHPRDDEGAERAPRAPRADGGERGERPAARKAAPRGRADDGGPRGGRGGAAGRSGGRGDAPRPRRGTDRER